MTSLGADFVVIDDRDAGRVDAWSTRRLPFEPKGSMVEFRSAIRAGLAALGDGSGRLLCVYSSRSAEMCDAENVLLYNVGVSNFSRIAARSMAFERSYDLPPCPGELAGPARHHHLYLAHPTEGLLHWRVQTVVSSWQGRLPDRLDDAGGWWWSTRACSPTTRGVSLQGQRFGLRVRLNPTRRALVGIIKPMLDGIIAAFHSDDSPESVAVGRIAVRLPQDPVAVESRLRSGERALGARRLVWAFRNGVQWNPGDDLCVACRLEVDESLDPMSFEGELLRLSIASESHPSELDASDK